MDDLQSISLYQHSGSKALLIPFTAAETALTGKSRFQSNPHLAQSVVKRRAFSSLRLKFNSTWLWMAHHEASVLSHRAFLDLLACQHDRCFQYLCCADLNLRGRAAGTHFFQRCESSSPPIEMACLQLANRDKIRVIQLDSKVEHNGLATTIRRHWHAVETTQKYGVTVYQLQGNPWLTNETSKDKNNVNARKLIMGILNYMNEQGWQRVVPFVCTISDWDADSLLFLREFTSEQSRPREFCAVSLERRHKIRLIGGADECTQTAFQESVSRHWIITETNRIAHDNLQLKLRGAPWYPVSTAENIASAQLVCAVLQGLWDQGWRWHCALDLSKSLGDKSTFVLARTLAGEDDFSGGRISCVQPKGSGKVNLVSFPPSVLERCIAQIKIAQWSTRLLEVERCSDHSATLHFDKTELHKSYRTDDKIVTAKLYTELLRIVAVEGTTMLGTADISARYQSDDNSSYSLDTDVFFLWFPFLTRIL
jgi:hypothetical protein